VLRVATWNVHLGLRLGRVLEELAALPRLDLLALQEASEHGGRLDADRVAQALGPRYRAWQVRAQRLRGLPQANALVWDAMRIEVRERDVLDLPTPAGRLLRRLPPSQRNALVAEGCAGGRSLRVAVVHLDVLGIAHKYAQLSHVLDECARRPPADLALILGDLNTYGHHGAMRWPGLREMAARRGFEELSAGIRWTHSAARVRQKLDAVFAAPAGIPHRTWAAPTGASDHRPVLVELEA
jgi:endonuclease/exonuclease/phosphatase family metal-dependent hydrolase